MTSEDAHVHTIRQGKARQGLTAGARPKAKAGAGAKARAWAKAGAKAGIRAKAGARARAKASARAGARAHTKAKAGGKARARAKASAWARQGQGRRQERRQGQKQAKVWGGAQAKRFHCHTKPQCNQCVHTFVCKWQTPNPMSCNLYLKRKMSAGSQLI